MELKDAVGKTIKLGSYIRYTGTGTIGKVVDFKVEDDKNWIKINELNLWYSLDSVEVVDKSKIKSNKHKNQKDIDFEDLTDDLEDVSLISGGAEGGG